MTRTKNRIVAASAPPAIAHPLGESFDAIWRKGIARYTWVWKTWMVASTSLVRIWEARSMASEAFSTEVIAWVGSESWPVASCWAAFVPAAWVDSSESIALVSVPEKLPLPDAGAPALGAGPTLHSLGPSGPTAPEMAGIT